MIAWFRKSLERPPYWLYLFLCALVAFAVVIYFYSPRFVVWQGLDLPLALGNADINRANDALKQLADPFTQDVRATNAIIRWRLLFPLVGHYLHLPAPVYLSLPFVGTLLALGFVAHATCRATRDRLHGLLVAVLAATGSWFFVSTGWLGYFDSWYILGLLWVAFSPSRGLLLTACLLAPWVDERFVLALPVAMLVRRLFRWNDSAFRSAGWRKDLLLVTLGILPYIIGRLIIISTGADSSESVLKPGHPFHTPHFLPNLLLGLWHSLRGLWVFVGLLFWVVYRLHSRGGAVLLGGAMTVIFAVCLYLAGDVSRSLSMFLPLPLLGICFAHRHYPQWIGPTFVSVLIFNLVAPASHVMTAFRLPIFNLRYELFHFQVPPDEVNPVAYNQRAVALMNQNQFDEALELLRWSLKLKPDYALALSHSGYAKAAKGQIEEAMSDLSAAIRVDPTLPDAYYFRGLVHSHVKRPSEAAADFSQALRLAPPDWPHRAEAQRRLTEGRP